MCMMCLKYRIIQITSINCYKEPVNIKSNQFYLDTAYLTNDSGVFTINKTNNNDKNKK